MVKYHISKNSQKPAICLAKKEPCKLGSHYDNVDDAINSIEEKLSKEYGETTTTSKKKKEPSTITLYRDGVLEAPESHFPDLQKITEDVDALKPEDGRQGRLGGIFASTNIGSMGRWVLGNEYKNNISRVEFKVFTDSNIYVYPVKAWEDYSWALEQDDSSAKAYWETGVKLKDFIKTEDFHNPHGEWEIFLPKEDIKEDSAKTVSENRILKNTEGDHHRELHLFFKKGKKFTCEECDKSLEKLEKY